MGMIAEDRVLQTLRTSAKDGVLLIEERSGSRFGARRLRGVNAEVRVRKDAVPIKE